MGLRRRGRRSLRRWEHAHGPRAQRQCVGHRRGTRRDLFRDARAERAVEDGLAAFHVRFDPRRRRIRERTGGDERLSLLDGSRRRLGHRVRPRDARFTADRGRSAQAARSVAIVDHRVLARRGSGSPPRSRTFRVRCRPSHRCRPTGAGRVRVFGPVSASRSLCIRPCRLQTTGRCRVAPTGLWAGRGTDRGRRATLVLDRSRSAERFSDHRRQRARVLPVNGAALLEMSHPKTIS